MTKTIRLTFGKHPIGDAYIVMLVNKDTSASLPILSVKLNGSKNLATSITLRQAQSLIPNSAQC